MDNITGNMPNRKPVQPSVTPTPVQRQPQLQPQAQPAPRKKRQKRIILPIVALVIVALIGAGMWLLGRNAGAGAQIDGGKYQALFLTNGQVYFGKLQTLGDTYYKLTDIFYLQADTTSTDSKNPQETATASTDNVKLIKLGSEVHGPDDAMIVNRDQVLFFENLKKDGKVSASITDYTKNK